MTVDLSNLPLIEFTEQEMANLLRMAGGDAKGNPLGEQEEKSEIDQDKTQNQS